MARVTLTPVAVPPQNASSLSVANLTTLAAAGVAPGGTGTGNGVTFVNSPGQTLLLVSVGSTATTPTIAAGAVSAAVTLNALAVNDLSLLGAFYAAMFLTSGSPLIAVDFSSITNIKCVALQLGGLY